MIEVVASPGGGESLPDTGAQTPLSGLRRRVVGYVGAVTKDLAGAVTAGAGEWVKPDAPLPPNEFTDHTPLPETLRSLYDRNRTQAELSEEQVLGAWTGPVGRIPGRGVDDVVAAAILTGGRIPEAVELTERDHALVSSALGVLGFPVGPVRFGSTVEARRRADLTGSATGTDNNITWLPGEQSVLECMEQHTSVAGLIVAAAIFEHMHPDDLRGKLATTLKRKARFSGPGAGDFKSEFEAPRNPQERQLFDYANGIIATAYGDQMMRVTPGSMAPMLLASAIESLGARRNIPPALAAVLITHYRRTWKINKMHHATYPPEMERLYEQILLTEGRARHEARRQLEAQAEGTGRRVSQAEVNVLAGQLEQERQLDYLADVARTYQQTRMQIVRDARETALEAHRQAEGREATELGWERHIKSGAFNYSLALVSDPEVVYVAGQKAIADSDIPRAIRTTMALYERALMGDRDAADGYASLRDQALGAMLHHLDRGEERIRAGFISPEESLLILAEMDYRHDDAHVTATIQGLYRALQESVFVQKKVESRTGGGDALKPEVREIDLPVYYSERAKAVMAVVAHTKRLERSLIMLMGTSYGAALRWTDPWLQRLQTTRHMRAVEAAEKEFPLSGRDRMALIYELGQLEKWKGDFRDGPVRQVVSDARSYWRGMQTKTRKAVASGSWTRH